MIGHETENIFITGSAHPQLAQDIREALNTEVYKCASVFPDNETFVEFPVSVRYKHVFIIQPAPPPRQNDYLMEIKMMAWAAKTCAAQEVTAIIPYFPYARADRPNKGRVCKAVELVSNELWRSGIDNIVTIDLHAEQSATGDGQPRRWDNFYGSYTLIPAIKELNLLPDNTRVVAPDPNAAGRARFCNSKLGFLWDITTADKSRGSDPRNINKMVLYGDFKGVVCIGIDDMISTGGTFIEMAGILKRNGAESLYLAATHGIFAPPALERITNTTLIPKGGVLVTDTIPPRPEVLNHEKIRVYKIAPLIVEYIQRSVSKKTGMSELFGAVADSVTCLNPS